MLLGYEHIKVNFGNLNGPEGNVYCVMGRVQDAMRNAGYTQEEVETVMEEAKKGDYDHVLNTFFDAFDCSYDGYDEYDNEGFDYDAEEEDCS